MAGPGRNDPCPCGSGKKFKHCCLTRAQAATGITPRDRTEAFEALLKYSRREQFDTVIAEAAREWADMPLASASEALQAILEFQTSAEAFFDWLFFDVPGAMVGRSPIPSSTREGGRWRTEPSTTSG